MAATGLRERRKQETRLAISDMATRMFADHGFEAVTISQVATAAGVSKMTVTNYFPRKEDLVFDRSDMIIEGLARAVRDREAGQSMLTAVRRDYARSLAEGDVTNGVGGQRFTKMVTDSPVLASRLRELLDLREQALAGQIGGELGGVEAEHRLVAAQLASVHRVLYGEASRLSLEGQDRDRIRTWLAPLAERAFDTLEPALGQYGIKDSVDR